MTEYWLQKKTIGGWSMVTWYSDLDQAMTNYNKCIGKGDSGYSWRLCTVSVVEQSMLEEVTEVEAPEIVNLPQPKAGSPITITNTTDKPLKINAWGGTQSIVEPKSSWSDIPSDSSKPQHGLSGSVWVINHLSRQKLRVPASELQKHLDNGFERGGPRTEFR